MLQAPGPFLSFSSSRCKSGTRNAQSEASVQYRSVSFPDSVASNVATMGVGVCTYICPLLAHLSSDEERNQASEHKEFLKYFQPPWICGLRPSAHASCVAIALGGRSDLYDKAEACLHCRCLSVLAGVFALQMFIGPGRCGISLRPHANWIAVAIRQHKPHRSRIRRCVRALVAA